MKSSKSKIIRAAVITVVILATFAVGRWTVGPGAHETAGTAAADHQHDDDGGETTYYCPMHPGQTSTDPDATCPICGMDLVAGDPDEDEEDEDRDLPVLRLNERAMALMNVEVAPVERRTVEAPLHFLGRLEADETRLRDVVVRSSSYVEKLYANYQWQMVAEGEPLAEIDSPEVRAAARELLVNQRRVGPDNEGVLEGAKGRLRRLGVSADQIEEILETGEVPATYQIRSPIGGHIMNLSGREGHWLGDGDRLVQIMNPSRLWVQLEVYERDLAWLRPGLPVTLTVEAYPGETFEGELTFIDPHFDGRTRTARARVEVPNPEHRLKPAMFVRGTLRLEIGEQPPRLLEPPWGIAGVDEPDGAEPAGPPLVIPASAPLITGREAVVYVRDPEADRPTFEGRRIVLGTRAGDYYLVREGLEEGELVVTRGAFKIDSELQIRGRPSMMAPAREPEVEESEEVPDYREPPEIAAFADDVPASFGEELRPLLQGYLDWATGLADDDFEAAREGILALHDTLLEIGQHRLEGDAHVAWMEHYENLHVLTHRIGEAEELEGMRAHLQETTREIEEIVVSFGAGQLPTLYRMYCPMAHDDEGATWLQDHDTVDNAYFGASMLRCGEVLGEL